MLAEHIRYDAPEAIMNEAYAKAVMEIIHRGNAEMWPTKRFGDEIAAFIVETVEGAVDDAMNTDDMGAACATGPCCN